MHRHLVPDTIAAPFASYSHGVETADARRWLTISGQVGVDPAGHLAEDAAAQIEQAWRNVFAVLAAAEMAPANLVKVTAFLTRREDLAVYRDVRNRLLGDARPASSLLFVAGLADPAWRVEIEAVAAA